MADDLILSPGRYVVEIPAPFMSIGDGLRERLTNAHKWLTDNGGKLESYSPLMPDSYFVVFSLPREARWEFDFAEPERVPPEVTDYRTYKERNPTAFEEAAESVRPAVETADAVVHAGVSLFSEGGWKILFLLWALSKLGK